MGKKSTIEIAQKQRHVFLLRKVQENKTLSKMELTELKRYERQTAGKITVKAAVMPSTKPSRRAETKPLTKRGKKKSKKKRKARLPIGEEEVRRLGFEYENLVVADMAAGTKKLLSKILPKYPELQAAWDRGQFLRNLQALAGVVATVSEAAHKLNLPSVEALRDMLDSDSEVSDIWNQTRLNTIIEAREALLAAAREGNHVAIQAVENYLREEQRAPGGKADLARMRQVDLVELFGIPKSTLQHWTNEQGMPRNAGGTYNLAEVIRWYGRFIERKGEESIKVLPVDKLRDLRAEEKELNLATRKHQLLEREEVLAGFVGRWKDIIYAFEYKRRELAMLLHGQTVDHIENLLEQFFNDVRMSWLNNSREFLYLSEEAEQKFAECLELCTLN